MANETIVVAGATGNLGGRIVSQLIERGASVSALVRAGTASEKLAKLEKLGPRGVKVVQVDLSSASDLARACTGASAIVSALQGLRDVIVDAQTVLLDAAVAAGVSRFVPSDYSVDLTKLSAGENRNLDLRRTFRERLEKASIRSTSILNGAFSELLTYGIPLLDFKTKRVGYWDNADQKLDFTTMDNTAAFTAAAALDPAAPKILRIAGDLISARELAALASEVKNAQFELERLGSLDDLAGMIQRERAADPESEKQLFPRWQAGQYMHNMFSGRGKLEPLDNDRYPNIRWTRVRAVISATR